VGVHGGSSALNTACNAIEKRALADAGRFQTVPNGKTKKARISAGFSVS